MPESTTPAGWYIDPFGQADGRYWNGLRWTDAVSRGGVTLKLPPDPDQVAIPPIPGSELRAPAGPSAGPQGTPPPASPKRSPALAVIGVLVAIAVAVLIVVVLTRDDSGDTPTPATDTPASTGAPVTEPPVTEPPVTEPPVTNPPDTTPTTAG